MTRSQTIAQVAEQIVQQEGLLAGSQASRERPSEVVVVQPDLPSLLNAPDALIGQSGTMLAVFLPTRQESRSPDQLLGRLMLSRIALPAHTRCVLVFDAMTNHVGRSIERQQHHFNATYMLYGQGLEHLSSREIPAPSFELRQRFYDRAAEFYHQSLVNLARSHDLQDQQYFAVPHTLEAHHTQRLFESELTPAQLRALCLSGIHRDLTSREGELYISSDAFEQQRVAIVARTPAWRLDPVKPIRAAALAGWIVLQREPDRHLVDYATDVLEHWSDDDEEI